MSHFWISPYFGTPFSEPIEVCHKLKTFMQDTQHTVPHVFKNFFPEYVIFERFFSHVLQSHVNILFGVQNIRLLFSHFRTLYKPDLTAGPRILIALCLCSKSITSCSDISLPSLSRPTKQITELPWGPMMSWKNEIPTAVG